MLQYSGKLWTWPGSALPCLDQGTEPVFHDQIGEHSLPEGMEDTYRENSGEHFAGTIKFWQVRHDYCVPTDPGGVHTMFSVLPIIFHAFSACIFARERFWKSPRLLGIPCDCRSIVGRGHPLHSASRPCFQPWSGEKIGRDGSRSLPWISSII